jgi:tetratricopeptide (TPR) repeat protein
MAKISLRSYLREIENLIDRGQLDEAQAHCKHILSFYPKQLDAYRLLGKTLLEAQKYNEAEDLLQRVLSSVPDDFIAQIGMSVIREEESNLDAAIWHMERAYEVQPSNATIMGELKRLYGKRDGVEPQKIRLTRGALVRMYARTNLFPQAIAEARAALEEDINRVDLQIILAKLLFQTNQKVESSELCSKIITKYPYCLEANHILAEILPDTSKAEEARVFHDRVIALDPYAAFISSNTPSSDLVPENAVQIDRLENISTAPSWSLHSATSLQSGDGAQPDWLRSMISDQPDTDQEQPSEGAKPEVEQPGAEIPGWMQSAGWSPSTGKEEKPAEPAPDQEAVEEAAIPADIPDWLKNIQSTQGEAVKPVEAEVAGQEPLAEATPQPARNQKTSEETPGWLRAIEETNEKPSAPGESEGEKSEGIGIEMEKVPGPFPFSLDDNLKTETPSSVSSIESISESQPSQAGDSSTAPNDWLEESNMPLSSGKTGPILPSVELPEWLKEIEITPEGDESLRAGKTGPIRESEILPDWLKDFQGPAETTERPTESKVEPEKLVEPPPPAPSAPEKITLPEPMIESKEPEPTFPVLEKTPLVEEAPSSEKEPEVQPQVETPAAMDQSIDLNQWLSQVENEPTEPEGKVTLPTQEEPPEKPQPSEPVVEIPVFSEEAEKPPVETSAPRAEKKLSGSGSSILDLQDLKEDLEKKRLMEASRKVNNLIKNTSLVDETINQLLTVQPQLTSEAEYWQMLGDAFKRKGNFHKALEAYNKAEDLCQ